MMETLGTQSISVALVLAIVLGPGWICVKLLYRRKKLERQRRRSPLTKDLLRTPGHTLREQMEEGRSDLGAELMVLMFLPATVLAFLYVTSLVSGRATSIGVLAAMVAGVVAFSAYQTRKLLLRAKQLEQWGLGLDAEMAAGQELDQLMRQGAVVFHDLAADKFNIDHVVISRRGVFAVETKGYRKPIRDGGSADATVLYDGKVLRFPDWADSKPLAQAERQARWLADWLSRATGERIEVMPVLALPGWYVERTGRGPVLVLNGVDLKDHLLKAHDAKPLSEEQMMRVAHQVEQRCRDVRPFYRPVDEVTQ